MVVSSLKSTLLTPIATASILLSATALVLGFYLGLRRESQATQTDCNDDSLSRRGQADGDKSEEETVADEGLSAVQAGMMEPCKLVLVVRTDLKMSPGTIAAHCSHATLACYKALMKRNPKLVRHWERTGQAKIALKATSEEQLMELEAIARSINLCARSIQNQCPPEMAQGTRTILGIGPAPVGLINQVTGKLRLL